MHQGNYRYDLFMLYWNFYYIGLTKNYFNDQRRLNISAKRFLGVFLITGTKHVKNKTTNGISQASGLVIHIKVSKPS